MYVYNIDFKNQLKNGWSIIIFLCGSIALPFYMTYRFGLNDINTYVLMSTILFLVFFVPQVIIHINYYLINRKDIFYYDPDNRRITIEYGGVNYTFRFEDIERIVRYMSYPLAEKRVLWFPWDAYNHSIISLKDGKSFLITSLLVPNLDLPIEHEKVVIEKSFYRLPPSQSSKK